MEKHVGSLGANEILELVFVYLAEVSSLKDYDEILNVLAGMGRALTSADRCTIWVVSDDKRTIWTKVAQGIDKIEIPIDSGIVGNAISNGTRELIDDVYLDTRFNSDIDKETGYRTKSMMVIPLYDYDDNIIGAFQVINHLGDSDKFDARDLERLTLASTYAAETLISAALAQEIEETQKEVVFTMGAIGESRSKETGNHVKRVAEYSKILALAYGLDEDEAELLKEASPMHDIGKIAIPDSILKKPGRFDENERRIMETHAELGYHMIKNSKRALLKAAAIVAYEHHEKWDGTGYPRKLKGEEIHIYGRITAVADVFDALGSDRVYKKAWEDARIFQLFQEERGRHFEPKLVDLFFENREKLLEARAKFQDTFAKKVDAKREKSIQILGAYGTKAKGYGVSSFFLNPQNVIDAGNLLDPLNVDSINIENIWITHSHLDHIADIAYILDNYLHMRKKSLTIRALPETIAMIKANFLNDIIWPDFSKIRLNNSDEMVITYEEIEFKKEYLIGQEESIRAFETDHTVVSCGYVYTKQGASVAITSDTYSLESLLEEVQNHPNITSIVVECSFPNELSVLAKESKHLTPQLLFKGLQRVQEKDIKLYINHRKPAYLFQISEDMEQCRGAWEPILLEDGSTINF